MQIEIGGLVLVNGKRVVRVEDMKADGSKIKVCGGWIAARVATPVRSAEAQKNEDARREQAIYNALSALAADLRRSLR
jgi:cytolysin (calcineurin-like family phosphatase)